jgi:protein-tyrosine phosphatase
VNSFANLRDVSRGLPAGTIREGVLLRSDAPLAGDSVPEGIAWPPATIIDLRHPVELDGRAHPLAGEATAVHGVSLVDPSAPGPEGPGTDDLADFYRRLLDSPASGLVRVATTVARSEGPVLVHCLAGKDRTGAVIALLLRLIGVDRDLVIDEYLLTNLAAPVLIHRLRHHYSTMDHRRAKADLITVTNIEAPRDLIVGIMDYWDAQPGGTAGWYMQHGGDEASLAALTSLLTGA